MSSGLRAGWSVYEGEAGKARWVIRRVRRGAVPSLSDPIVASSHNYILALQQVDIAGLTRRGPGPGDPPGLVEVWS
jgi:hypothetical protein